MVYQKEHLSLNPRQILSLETKCIEDHVPECQAFSPLHIDIRAMLAFAKKGDWQKALEVMEKATYFPRILAMSCTEPHLSACKRRDVGGSINLCAIERVIVREAEARVREINPYVRLSITVAVIGAGVAGLTAAAYLAEKGFKVSVFEKDARLGGKIWNIRGLTEEMIRQDLAFLDGKVDFHLHQEIGKDIEYQYIFDTFEGVILANDSNLDGAGMKLTASGKPVFDEETWQSSNSKVFVAGSAIRDDYSAEESMAIGKRAAISLDRYLKKVSLTANRTNEGVFQTKLVVNVDNEQIIPPVVAKDPDRFTAAEAMEEASRCLDCHCKECVRGCVMLEKYGKKPRQYIREIANNLIVAIGRRTYNNFINACTFCGLCGDVCPNSLDMGDICLSAREEMVRTNKMPPAIHDFPIRDMLFSNSGEFSLCLHAPGTNNSRYLFFPGCQQAASAPQYIRPIYDYLRANLPGNTGLFLGCCGAPAHWSGRSNLFSETVADLEKKWIEMGKPIVITGCTTCYQELKNIDGMELISLWECIEKYGLPKEAVKYHKNEPVAIHDPCTTRHEPQIFESVRRIMEELEYPVEELEYTKDKTCCCGYGGLAIFGNPEVTEEALRRRVSQSPLDYLTYCWVCRDYFATKGQKETVHLMDLLFNNGEPSPCYDISDKRFNRRRLKEELLSTLWQGMAEPTVQTLPLVGNRPLRISRELRDIMARRLILVENAAETIEYAEKTGNKVLRPTDDHYFAHYQPGIITYWVEYSLTDEGFVLHNAYSHRLELLDGQKENEND